MSIPELSVVVLCYKSGERIIPYIEQMEREFADEGMIDYELVLVGNHRAGSADTTPQVIRALSQKNSRIVPVTLEKQGMLGWDVMSGFRAARGNILALIDGDGQMPSQDIVRLYRVLKSGEFDLVKTFRKTRRDGVYRKLISSSFNALFYLLFPRATFRDINAKPKLITRSAFAKMHLTCDGWFIDGEIMLEAMRLDLNIAEVPTVFHENEWRGSFVKFWTIFEFIGYMLRYRIRYWFY